MKLFSNLPGKLRSLFGLLRILIVILAVFWLLTIAYNIWVQKSVGHDARLMLKVGQVVLPTERGQVGLTSDLATEGSLALRSLHGELHVDVASNDPALASAVRQAIFPSLGIMLIFSFCLFTALRSVCANLERGDVFNDENLRLVRRIGALLIVYSLVGAGLELWASHVLHGYFSQHVVLTGLQSPVGFGNGFLRFTFSPGLITAPGGVLIGCLVLVVAEAFRRGLQLKAENDLTI